MYCNMHTLFCTSSGAPAVTRASTTSLWQFDAATWSAVSSFQLALSSFALWSMRCWTITLSPILAAAMRGISPCYWAIIILDHYCKNWLSFANLGDSVSVSSPLEKFQHKLFILLPHCNVEHCAALEDLNDNNLARIMTLYGSEIYYRSYKWRFHPVQIHIVPLQILLHFDQVTGEASIPKNLLFSLKLYCNN